MSKTESAKQTHSLLMRMVVSAMFLALAVVVNGFTEISIPLFGPDGMQIKLGSIFTSFPAFLFGPIYGGIVCGVSDIIGCFIKPTGAYVPWFTLTAFLAGFIKGYVFMLLKRRSASWIRIALAAAVIISAAAGIYSLVCIGNDNVYEGTFPSSENILSAQELFDNADNYSAPTKLALKYARSNSEKAKLPDDPAKHANYQIINVGGEDIIIKTSNFNSGFASTLNLICAVLIGFAVLGLLLFVFLTVTEKKYPTGGFAAKIFASLLSAELIQTSINSALLLNLYTGTYGKFTYALFNTPRVIEGFFICMVLTYFIYVLYQVYDSKIKSKLNVE